MDKIKLNFYRKFLIHRMLSKKKLKSIIFCKMKRNFSFRICVLNNNMNKKTSFVFSYQLTCDYDHIYTEDLYDLELSNLESVFSITTNRVKFQNRKINTKATIRTHCIQHTQQALRLPNLARLSTIYSEHLYIVYIPLFQKKLNIPDY